MAWVLLVGFGIDSLKGFVFGLMLFDSLLVTVGGMLYWLVGLCGIVQIGCLLFWFRVVGFC